MQPPNEKRKAAIIKEICQIESRLSPENLSCDGELSRSQIRVKENRLVRKIKKLEKEYIDIEMKPRPELTLSPAQMVLFNQRERQY
tara:strand:- start:66 stop:323 length:258 start_codon:yes stop_codon:yes gene_type:complete